MLDAVSLDQLRTFIAAVDEGSFSAASRKLLRAQSVVSETIGNLEQQIGVRLFDRSGRYRRLAEGPGERHIGWPGAGIVRGD
jgi:DNA-binding transcriptional LysR family regulator